MDLSLDRGSRIEADGIRASSLFQENVNRRGGSPVGDSVRLAGYVEGYSDGTAPDLLSSDDVAGVSLRVAGCNAGTILYVNREPLEFGMRRINKLLMTLTRGRLGRTGNLAAPAAAIRIGRHDRAFGSFSPAGCNYFVSRFAGIR